MSKPLQPLQDIKILDFSTLLPGPLASLILAEAGAEVLKLERPGFGEEMRYYPPFWDGESATYALLNRGKSGLEIDLKSAKAKARLIPLIEQADILLEQFRPGVMKRLGFDYEAVRKINPRLIYCSITGYGQNGPKARRAGHDLNYIGDSGLLSLSAGRGVAPVVPPVLAADIAGGTYPAVMNILLALRQRDLTGQGVYLDIAMAENLFPFAFWTWGEGQLSGEWPQSGKGLLTGGSPRYHLYPARCGRLVAVAALEDKFWEIFCGIIGLSERGGEPEALILAITGLIGQKDANEWAAEFEEANCCCTIVKTLDEAMRDAQFAARGLFDHQVQNQSGKSMNALPVPVMDVFRKPADKPQKAPPLTAALSGVIPAQAGIQSDNGKASRAALDSRLRGNDEAERGNDD